MHLGIWSVGRIRANDLVHRWSAHSGSGGRPSRFLCAAFSRRTFSMCSTYFLPSSIALRSRSSSLGFCAPSFPVIHTSLCTVVGIVACIRPRTPDWPSFRPPGRSCPSWPGSKPPPSSVLPAWQQSWRNVRGTHAPISRWRGCPLVCPPPSVHIFACCQRERTACRRICRSSCQSSTPPLPSVAPGQEVKRVSVSRHA